MKTLSLLRLFFIVYLVTRTIVEITLGSEIINDVFRGIHSRGLSHLYISPIALATFSFIVYLAIGLWLFHFLFQQRNWARILLLIVGWLTVGSAVFDMVFHPQISGLLTQIDHNTDWNRILFLDRVMGLLGLIYWGYLIYVLQFDRTVKHDFLSSLRETLTDQKS